MSPMEKRMRELTGELEFNPGTSDDVLRKVESRLNISLPTQYVDFLRQSNGAEGSVGENSYLVLWSIEEIEPLNEAYAVNEFAPGLIFIGSDGGDVAYAFDTRDEAMPIVEVPFIGMDVKAIKLCGRTFLEFLEYLHNQL